MLQLFHNIYIYLSKGAYGVPFETLVVHTGTFGTYGDGPHIILDATVDAGSGSRNSLYMQRRLRGPTYHTANGVYEDQCTYC